MIDRIELGQGDITTLDVDAIVTNGPCGSWGE